MAANTNYFGKNKKKTRKCKEHKSLKIELKWECLQKIDWKKKKKKLHWPACRLSKLFGEESLKLIKNVFQSSKLYLLTNLGAFLRDFCSHALPALRCALNFRLGGNPWRIKIWPYKELSINRFHHAWRYFGS